MGLREIKIKRMRILSEKKFAALQEELGLTGESEAMKEIIRIIDQVAPTDISVLIEGESGTGKELVARAIHKLSARSDKPMVIVNAGAIPEGIIESELFGHTRGAFTGAVQDRKGYFEAADKGTIFLDEIGEMPLLTQVKLLRALEQGEFLRVGASRLKGVDVRVIAASNRDLDQAVREGRFRRDLFYRLHAVTIKIPPLRQRSGDVSIMAEMFAAKYAEDQGIDFKGFSEEALGKMAQYHWPGNVRELKNFVESAMTLEKGARITPAIVSRHLLGRLDEAPGEFLPMRVERTVEESERQLIIRELFLLRNEISELKGMLFHRPLLPPSANEGEEVPEMYPKAVEEPPVLLRDKDAGQYSISEMEKDLIRQTLEQFNHNRRLTANALKISERTLYRKLQSYDLS